MTINDTTLRGVKIGKGFKDSLLSPRQIKPYITNESRLEHGVRVLDTPIRYAQRNLTLEFQITGRTEVEFKMNKENFFSMIYSGKVKLAVPEITTDVFHLLYTGASSTYSSGLSNLACRVKLGFTEPNPGNRV